MGDRAYVLEVRKVDGRRVMLGTMGYADAAEFKALTERLDEADAERDARWKHADAERVQRPVTKETAS